MNHNKYICIIEDLTDGQDEYTNLNDLKSDLNTDLGMIGLCVIDIKRYNEAPVSAEQPTKCDELNCPICERAAPSVASAPFPAKRAKCPRCGSEKPGRYGLECSGIYTSHLWHNGPPSVASEDSNKNQNVNNLTDDRMRKAAEEIIAEQPMDGYRYAETKNVIVIIAMHYAASQLSTGKNKEG